MIEAEEEEEDDDGDKEVEEDVVELVTRYANNPWVPVLEQRYRFSWFFKELRYCCS